MRDVGVVLPGQIALKFVAWIAAIAPKSSTPGGHGMVR
jgi:hypothetical protein